MKYTKTYLRFNLNTGSIKEDMQADELRNDRMMNVSVSSAMKLGYETLDETNMTYNNKKVVAIQAKQHKDDLLIEIITFN